MSMKALDVFGKRLRVTTCKARLKQPSFIISSGEQAADVGQAKQDPLPMIQHLREVVLAIGKNVVRAAYINSVPHVDIILAALLHVQRNLCVLSRWNILVILNVTTQRQHND